ncbi:hypothetical protein [Micromonospora avicenniae]|uniref:hypothetical protein n=1 Tax=Micromonospora avicenniae TaxID=1198245 RepID=UPI0033281E87
MLATRPRRDVTARLVELAPRNAGIAAAAARAAGLTGPQVVVDDAAARTGDAAAGTVVSSTTPRTAAGVLPSGDPS